MRSVVLPGRGGIALSPRQAQVVELATGASSTTEIAVRLAIATAAPALIASALDAA